MHTALWVKPMQFLRVCVALAAMAGAARAEGPIVKPTYPLTARLAVTSESSGGCFVPDIDLRGCRIAVEEYLRDAFEHRRRRTFAAPPAGTTVNLEIAISLDHADVNTMVEG